MESLDGRAERFGRLTQGGDESVDLARAALVIGAVERPDLDAAPYLALLDEFGDGVRRRAGSTSDPDRLAEALRAHLFDDLGFRGDEQDYYDPRNSLLDAVLDRRRGLPITLSVLCLETARRAGLEMVGVGAPQHFLVKYRNAQGDQFLDPFNEGRRIPIGPLRERIAQLSGEHAVDAMLAGVTKRQILARILVNLKGAHLRRRGYDQALVVSDYILAMTPWDFPAMRDRGLLQRQLKRPIEALADLHAYRENVPDAPDHAQVDLVIRELTNEPG